MDFKIAGTRRGVTAVQLDVKEPIPMDSVLEAIRLALPGRLKLLDSMKDCVQTAFDGSLKRPDLKLCAPRVEVIRFDPNRKRDLVGPGGVVLRQLEERYGVEMDLTQEGRCLLFGVDRGLVQKAKSTILELVGDVVEGEVYEGTVIELLDFGAVVELLRNKEGLLHVSEISAEDDIGSHSDGAGGYVRAKLKLGQKLDLLCIGVDPVQGSVKLSRKALLKRNRLEA